MIKQIFFKLNNQFAALALKILMGFLGLAFSCFGLAKIHIEPYAGWSLTYTNTKPIQEKTLNKARESLNYLKEGRYYHGLIPGVRLGYTSLGLAVGVDMTFGFWKSLYRENFTSSSDQETVFPLLPGLFASYKLPLLFRVYATVIPPFARLYFKNERGILKSCDRSGGAKLGLSYISLPFFSVNFEYMPLYIRGTDCQTWSHTGAIYANFTF